MRSRTDSLELLYRFAGPLEAMLDIMAWTAAAYLGVYIRYLDIGDADLGSLVKFVPLVAIVQCAVGLSVGLYRKKWRYGSIDEVAALLATAVLTTAALMIIDRWYLHPRLVPLSAVVMGGLVGLVLMAGVRYVWRLVLERLRRPGDRAERTIVFGAGESGIQVITSMLRNPESSLVPVALVDDDPAKRRLNIKRVRVRGTRADLREVAAQTQATVLLIAVPDADSELVGDLVRRANDAHLRVKVLPTAEELLGHEPGVGDIRDVSEADLLGRHAITTDMESIAGYINNRRVLVTGAGGSIGSELCRQLSRFGPLELMMLDRDESALHGVQLSIEGRALLDTPNLILADLRDADQIKRIFKERRPEVVFHAAALKHLPLLEQYPAEAVKSNVIGTLTMLEAAAETGVRHFVNISTDKAANPVSVLGLSKRAAERLTAHYAGRAEGTYLSVRFGNVLGSRGSVLTSFQSQIESGGPVTVTDREVTRFFMTVNEAVQLVIQAGAIGAPGEVLVLDMGKPVRIADVADRLVRQSGRPIRIIYTGLRPGEKLHEELLGDGEPDVRPRHPLISHVPVPALTPDSLADAPNAGDAATVVTWLRHLVAEV